MWSRPRFCTIPLKRKRDSCSPRQPRLSGSLIERVIVSSSLSQLLTTSKTATVLHPPKIADKSLFWNILLITPTRSRFCRPFPKRNDCFQEFDSIPGEGGIPPVAPRAVHEGINGFDNQSTNMCPVPQRMARRLEGWRWAKGEPRRSACGFSPVARAWGKE